MSVTGRNVRYFLVKTKNIVSSYPSLNCGAACGRVIDIYNGGGFLSTLQEIDAFSHVIFNVNIIDLISLPIAHDSMSLPPGGNH